MQHYTTFHFRSLLFAKVGFLNKNGSELPQSGTNVKGSKGSWAIGFSLYGTRNVCVYLGIIFTINVNLSLDTNNI